MLFFFLAMLIYSEFTSEFLYSCSPMATIQLYQGKCVFWGRDLKPCHQADALMCIAASPASEGSLISLFVPQPLPVEDAFVVSNSYKEHFDLVLLESPPPPFTVIL